MCSHFGITRERLLPAAHAGDMQALGLVLESYRPLLLMLAQNQLSADLRAKADPSDLVQDAFVTAFRSFGTFHGHCLREFQAWLVRIFQHTVTEFARRYHCTRKRQSIGESSLDDPRSRVLMEELVGREADPLCEVLRNEAGQVLETTLAQLPDQDRLVIDLRYRQHLPYPLIANQLHCTEGAIRRRWLRALARWRVEVVSRYGAA